MGESLQERRVSRRTVGFAAFAAMCCLAWGLPVSAQASTVPSIASESVSHITPTDATVEAQVNLHEAGAGAYYQFQLVKESSEYASEILCPVKLPPASDGCDGTQSASALPISFIPGNTEQPGVDLPAILVLASAGVTLKPATTYHYRVLVARRVKTEDTTQWEPPTVYGADQTFTTPPAIESESVSNITATDATIEAQINTGGRETTYRVWVGNYPECIEEMMEECDSSAKHPIDGTLAGSASPTRISIDVAHAWHALLPGSSYIYHVAATNSDWAFQGSAYGENKTFTTPTAKAPAIDSESVSHLTPTDATLEAQINTEGLETTYVFYLQGPVFPCLEAEPPCMVEEPAPVALPPGNLLGSFAGQSVSADLNSAGVSLDPGAHYRYSVTATSAAGATRGQTQRFVAPEDGVQPLNTNPTPGSYPTEPGSSTGQGTVTPTANDSANHGTPSPKATGLTNGRKLVKALKACGKKVRHVNRKKCEKEARARYGPRGKKAVRRK
jgi:hypothetical protein